MKIDFNQVRKLAHKNVSNLNELLNAKTVKGVITLKSHEIAYLLNDLRTNIRDIAATYEEGDPEFRDLSKELPKITEYKF